MPDFKKTYDTEGSTRSVVIPIDENYMGLKQFNALNELVNNEMKDGVRSFTFDMANLNTINSSGLGILISCLKNIKSSNGSLKISNANDKILSIFKLTKLNNIFEFEKGS